MKFFINNLIYKLDHVFKYLIFVFKWRFRLKSCGSLSYWVSPIRILNPSLINLGNNIIILNNARIEIHKLDSQTEGLQIEDGVNIGHNFFCTSARSVLIKKGTLISDNVAIIDNNHAHVRGKSSVLTKLFSRPIIIEKNVTIYRNSTILQGVTIGEGSVIGANSLIKNDVDPFVVVAGCPAKKIGNIQ